ncbi:Gfo/Idh/MocA family oxidoreductase [Ignisphaera sp. 4213-co]|uniref:Gfo/Idh/MocA family oxidoreductase n=1 Tax=Ignisphaera cupida TaxID=3050454 RepID=A0ABD4Z5H1_9CREN|nr:Gfo/Idh/MocA family oxidoreductase [Ignisphaera sp. 4213-co]MDK6028198.1 Gfo/Idh/MocA family oxidoreductase [Ignisphaera sp. 4213-co]
MSRRIGVAVIGLGTIGQVHVEALKDLEKSTNLVKLVGIHSLSRRKVREFASRYGCKGYESYDDVVRDPEVDVVVIATPHYLHAWQAFYAMEHGKHVIVEKPMATTVTAAREMISKARRKGIKLGVIFQGRYADGVVELKRYVDSNALGKILLVTGEMMWYRDETSYYLKDELARSWRGLWATEGGGALINQAIHTIDLMLWFGGDVEEVVGYIDNLTHPSVNVEDIGIGVMKYRSGGYGVLIANLFTKPSTYQYRRIKIFGSKGQAELWDNELVFLKTEDDISIERKPGYSSETLKVPGGLHRKLFEDFLKALSEDRDFPITGEEGLKSLEIVRAIYYSSTRKTHVKLPLLADGVF